MGKSSSPTPPNPQATAASQASANRDAVRESALTSQINQVTPYGSLRYTGSVGEPDRTAWQTLAPAQQQMLNQANQAGMQYGQIANSQLGQVAGTLSTPFDINSLGPTPTADPAAWQRAYDSIIQRNQPQADQQRAAMQTQLANQGIDLGSEAYRNANDIYNRGQNDFALGAQGLATGQQQADFGMQQGAYNQALQSALTGRQVPMNELAALMSGQQVQQPQFVNSGQYNVAPADIMGATYGNYNAEINAAAAKNQGLYGLYGAGLQAAAYTSPEWSSWSDRRLKRDIVRIGEVDGMGVYTFRYVWDNVRRIGLMAQEVMRVRPHAVSEINGFLAVNYAEALA